MNRNGIISAGNWLVDNIKMIDTYPAAGNLTVINNIEVGLGGCSHNVLVDLAKLDAGIPLFAGGCIGNDANGEYVINEIRKHNIDDSNMIKLSDTPTSYTDVMSESSDRHSRTFFHFKGANSRLDENMILNMHSQAKIFHLGYLLLLDELDKDNEEFGICAAKVLCALSEQGYLTSVDLVSEESDRFRHIVTPCLPYIDYLIINEIEAGGILGENMRDDNGNLLEDKIRSAAKSLLDMGIRQMCAIHFPEGGYAVSKCGEKSWKPSFSIKGGDVVSTVGAGDAFCAGMLYAIHENYPLDYALEIANCSAMFNIKNATSTGGAPTIKTITDFISQNK